MPIGTPAFTYPTPTRHQLVNEGSYLVATQVGIASGALGTGVTWPTTTTSFSDTGPVGFYILNNEPTAGGKTIFMDYVKLIATAVATGTTSVRYACILDVAARAITTNNTSAVVPVCPNSAAANVSSPTIRVQTSATASVFGASSSGSRVVATGALGGLNIAQHVYGVTFGDAAPCGMSTGATDAAGAPGRGWDFAPPVGIAPGHCLTIAFWSPGSSASMAPEFELGMWARSV